MGEVYRIGPGTALIPAPGMVVTTAGVMTPRLGSVTVISADVSMECANVNTRFFRLFYNPCDFEVHENTYCIYILQLYFRFYSFLKNTL